MKKKHLINILIITFSILVIVLATTRFENTFGSDTDWINQHTVFPDYFRQFFYATGRILPNFSLNYGAGQNLFNISYYGLLSPIILPSYFLPFLDMTTYITIVNILLVIGSGILFYKWLLNNKFKSNLSLITTLIFVLSESFIFHMHRHIMFVNYMPFLIMSLMGIDKFVLKKEKSLLIFSVFLMIMTSYYYSVGGILVIGCYFLYKYFAVTKKFVFKDFSKELLKLIFLVLIAVCMAGILLLPTIYTLLAGRASSEISTNWLSLFIPSLEFNNIFSGTYAIGLSMLGFVALLYMLFSKKRKNVILAIFVSIIFFFPIFRYLLNGGLYLREKCFIPFIPLISLMIGLFLKDLNTQKVDIKKFLIFLVIINIPLYFFNQKEYFYIYLIGIMLGLYYVYRVKNIKLFSIGLVLTTFIIAFVSNYNEDVVSLNEYETFFNETYETDIKEVIENDTSFYRMNNLLYPIKTVNKIYDSRYYTTNLYSSTYNKYYLSFVRDTFKQNNPDFNYFFVSASNNKLFNNYMGVKYLYVDYDLGLGYEKVTDKVYQNLDAFPIAYARSNILSEEIFDSLSYPYNIEVLLNNVVVSGDSSNANINTNIEKVNLNFTLENLDSDNIKITKEEKGYKIKVFESDTFTVKFETPIKNKVLFINLFGLKRNGCGNGNTYININHVNNLLTCSSWIYHNQNEDFHYVITNEEINSLEVEIGRGEYTIEEYETYLLDYSLIKDIEDNLDEFKIVSYENDTIVGNIEVTNDGYFVASIPYDEGFTIKVNGEEQEYELVNKAFIGFPIQEGYYEIEITYQSPWLKEGKIVSLVGFSLFGIFFLFDLRKKLKKD